MGRMKNLIETLGLVSFGYTKEEGINVKMFDIHDLEECVTVNGKVEVKFKGLTSTIPLKEFDMEARNKIRSWSIKNNSELGKALNGE